MILLLILGCASALYCLGLLFTIAARALPVYSGLSIGFLVHHLGSGAGAAIVCGFVAGVLVMIAAEHLVHHARNPKTRLIAIAAVILPAATAGYQLSLGLGRIAIENTALLHLMGMAGAVAVGRMAWQRLVVHPLL